MQLEILNSRTVADLQDDFSKEFPFLKLEIVRIRTGSEEQDIQFCGPENLLKKCRENHLEGIFIINNTASISTFQHHMLDDYGLNVEVFRRCGNSWIATKLSRSWSLEHQNNEGFETTSFEKPNS